MAKTLLVSSIAGQVLSTANTQQFWWSGGGCTINVNTARIITQVLHRSPGTISDFTINLFTNTVNAATAFTLEVNSATGNLAISVPTATTGNFAEGTPTTQALSAGDLVALRSIPGAGSTGVFSMTANSYVFDATTDTVTRMVSLDQVAKTTASTTWFQGLGGGAVNTTTEANTKTRMRKAGTLKNLCIEVLTNARTTATTIRTRKNGANGNGVISLAGGTTGFVEETTLTDTVSAGEDWNYSITTSTGTQTLSIQTFQIDFVTTTGHGIIPTWNAQLSTITDNTVRYSGLGGGSRVGFTMYTATEADMDIKASAAFTMSELTTTITQNGVSSASTLILRKGAADTALSVSITGSTTGTFSDSTNTVVVAASDMLALQFTVPSVSGAQTITSVTTTVYTFISTGTNYNRSPTAEDITVADSSTTRMISAIRVPSADTTTITAGTATRATQAFRSPSSDSTTVADSSLIARKGYQGIPSADTITVADSSLNRLLSALRLPSTDTTTITDSSLTRLTQAFRLPSTDTTTVADGSLVGAKVVPRLPSADTITISDVSLTRLLSAVRSPSDTLSISDASLTRATQAFRAPSSDSTTIADLSLIAVKTLSRLPSTDTTTISDFSLTRLLSSRRLPSTDTTTISDASLTRVYSALRIPSADTTTVADASLDRVIKSVILRSPAEENTTVADGSLTRSYRALRLPTTESESIADVSLTRLLSLLRSPSSDTTTISENIDITLSGRISRSVEDTTTIADSSLTRRLSAIRLPSTDTSNVNEQVTRIKTLPRLTTTDTVNVSESSPARVVSLSRPVSSDTSNVIESSLTRLLRALRAPSTDSVTVSELNSIISFGRSITETLNITEPILNRIVTSIRELTDDTEVTEAVFYQTYHKFLIDSVIVAESLFMERQQLSGYTTYATPEEVRPLLGNLGDQRTDAQINLAIAAAYDEINRHTNRLPPNDWKETDQDWDIIKRLARYIATTEMAIGIKDFDTDDIEKKIDEDFALIDARGGSESTSDLIVSSSSETYALASEGIIWSTRYPNLRKRSRVRGTENSNLFEMI